METDRTTEEDTSLAERSLLSQIVESAPDGMVFVNASTGRLIVNQSFRELFGEPIDPAKGTAQKLGILCWPDGRPLEANELPSSRVLRGETMVEYELLVVRRDGQRIPVTERASLVRDSPGTVAGVVITYRDISAQKELDRLREEFVAMVAHDLRNPLQSILLQLNMLEAGETPGTTAFDRLRRSATRLSQIATDLLDASRLELARVRLGKVKLEVARAVEDLVERVRPTLGAHEVSVDVRGRPRAALLDPARLDQILTNLLENAAKYSPDGTPIRVYVGDADGGVEIAVQDHGIGIAPEEMPRLFDRFYQTKRAREQKTGLGLGLYITKGFVEAHGGRVSVDSVPDRGSTFRLWFPAAPPSGEAAAPTP